MNLHRTTTVQSSHFLLVLLVLVLFENDAMAQLEPKRLPTDQTEQTVQDVERRQFRSRMDELVETGSVQRTPQERAAWKIRREARQASVAASRQREPRLRQAVTGETVAAQGPIPPPTIFVVNSSWDAPDDNVGNATCFTGYYNGNGSTVPECTLRAAIQEANLVPGSDSVIIQIDVVSAPRGADQYGFHNRNPDLDVWRVEVNEGDSGAQGALPTITRNNVHIDGTYQLDGSGDGSFDDAYCGNPWAGDTSIVKVMIDGTDLADNVPVLSITGDNVSIRGIAIANGDSVGINADGANDLALDCIHVGTDHFAKVAEPNGDHGIVFKNGENLHLTNSIVSGNAGSGLSLAGNNSVLATSFFGTDRTGTYAIGNGLAGFVDVVSSGASATNILASGNTTGVVLSGDEFTLSASKIGVNTAVSAAIPNVVGVYVTGNLNTIGGSGGGSHSYISGNTSHGVELTDTALDNVVANVAIGTDLAGTSAIPNGGVGVLDGGTNTIGKAPDASSPARTDISGAPNASGILSKSGEVLFIGTLISGNASHGIQSTGSTTVVNSFIGTNYSGLSALPNGGHGVYLLGGTDHVIGGTVAGSGNLISGNTNFGIRSDNGVSGGTIVGNLIGTDVTGTAAVGNGGLGIRVGSNFTIGGTTTSSRNVVSGNTVGISLAGAGNTVSGNFVGTNVAGTAAISNSAQGILVNAGNLGNIIGGGTTSHRNVISGNGGAGIEAGDNVIGIANNYVGTNAAGTAAIPNLNGGIRLTSTTSLIDQNLISGNTGDGLRFDTPCCTIDTDEPTLSKTAATANSIYRNKIGTDWFGVNPIPNTGDGVSMNGPAAAIGGTNTASFDRTYTNTIAYNGGAGVLSHSALTRLYANDIFGNGLLGIDLGGDGVTPNDYGSPPDLDAGPNDLQNFPDIVSATRVGSDSVDVVFDLYSTPSTTFYIDVFVSPSPDTSGYGEGQLYDARSIVATDGAGHAGFNGRIRAPNSEAGSWMTMTATNISTDRTSEFSGAVQIAGSALELSNGKVFLEGPYAAGSMGTALFGAGFLPLSQPYTDGLFTGTPAEYISPIVVESIPANTVDWVVLTLRDAPDPSGYVHRRIAFLRNDGILTDFDGSTSVLFPGVAEGNYYLVVCHRNHICAMSSAPVDFTSGSGTWDFSTGQAQAYSSGGNGLKHLGGGVYGLFAADNNADGNVTAPDFNQWNAETSAGATGYIRSDHNLDGISTAPDFNLWNANTSAGAASQVPD